MTLITNDLKKLGINMIFFFRSQPYKKRLVNKTKYSTKILLRGYLDPPKGEILKNWKKLNDSYLNLQNLETTG